MRQQLSELHGSGWYDESSDDDRHLLACVFIPSVQEALDNFTKCWNNHRIKGQAEIELPCGIVDMLWTNPPPPFKDCSYPITDQLVKEALDNVAVEDPDYIDFRTDIDDFVSENRRKGKIFPKNCGTEYRRLKELYHKRPRPT
eukprot:sb/3474081/